MPQDTLARPPSSPALMLPPLAGARPKAATAADAMALPPLGVAPPMPRKPPMDAPTVVRTPIGGSQLKFPRLVKPLLRPVASTPSAGVASGSNASIGKCNQEEERGPSLLDRPESNNELHEDEDEEKTRVSQRSATGASSRRGGSNNSDASDGTPKAHAKNRDFIKELEEKKRREREEKERQERRRKRQHDKSTQKILQEAALKKQQQGSEAPAPANPEQEEHLDEAQDPEDEKAEDDADRERKERARRQQKKLLKKQQRLLEELKVKKREKEEELEQERERERKRQAKVTRAILSAIQDANDKEDEAIASEANGNGNSPEAVSAIVEDVQVDEVEDQKRRAAKDQQEAMRRKQQEYLSKLAEQRKQKQREEEEARAMQERKKKKTQQEAARALQEAARRHQQEQEARERQLQMEQEAAAAAAAAAPQVNVEAMVARLSKLKERDAQVVPEARDFTSWKKRHGVRADQKVFIVTGCYPVIREELEKRGWFWNQDRTSPFFDLKWALKSDDLKSGGKLEKHQYVNHFAQNTAITTKVGLLHSLRRATVVQSFDCDSIFPRAFDLNEPSDMDAFVQDFRFGVAEGLLKQLVGRVVRQHGKREAGLMVNLGVLDVVLAIARKKVRSRRPECQVGDDGAVLSPAELFACSSLGDDPLEDSLDEDLATQQELVTELQWEVLSKCPVDQPGKLRASLAYSRKVYADDKTSGVDSGAPEGGNGNATGGPSAASVDTVLTAMEKKQQRRQEKRMAESFNREKARLSSLVSRVESVGTTQQREAERLVRALSSLCPQFHLNGGSEDLFDTSKPAPAPSQNVWIVKPAGLSRGRGIRVFNDLDALLGYADVENHKECQWVAQKYIENPLLVCRRKFDIRQWVLVTCWDPLTVWMHEDCYLRFSSEEYSTTDLSDQYVHLTNNSIQKYSDKFHDVYGTDDGDMMVEGNMWHSDEFRKYLKHKLALPEVWETQIRPAMRAIIVRALQCVQDRVTHRNNACELFGYDFMIDASFTPWLIEVNSSPACDYSTPTAERYVTAGLAGIVKVIVDLREFEESKKRGTSAGAEPDTGCWKRIHRGEFVGKPVSSFGADFQVRGAKLSRAALRRQLAKGGAVVNTIGGTTALAGGVSSASIPPVAASDDGDAQASDENSTDQEEGEETMLREDLREDQGIEVAEENGVDEGEEMMLREDQDIAAEENGVEAAAEETETPSDELVQGGGFAELSCDEDEDEDDGELSQTLEDSLL
jgi:hypothetical protein